MDEHEVEVIAKVQIDVLEVQPVESFLLDNSL